MDLSDACVDAIRAWALRTNAVREVWLFGSRAKDTSSPDSDVDLAIALTLPSPSGDWALHEYFKRRCEWALELKQVVGLHFDLRAFSPGTSKENEIHSTGIQLWARP